MIVVRIFPRKLVIYTKPKHIITAARNCPALIGRRCGFSAGIVLTSRISIGMPIRYMGIRDTSREMFPSRIHCGRRIDTTPMTSSCTA